MIITITIIAILVLVLLPSMGELISAELYEFLPGDLPVGVFVGHFEVFQHFLVFHHDAKRFHGLDEALDVDVSLSFHVRVRERRVRALLDSGHRHRCR